MTDRPRRSKRLRAEGGSHPANQPLDDQLVADAVRRLAPRIRQEQATLSLRAVRRLVEAALGLEEGSVDGRKALVAAEVDAVLATEAALPVAGDLPAEVVVLVLRQLDHDSLFTALATCRTWRAAADDDCLWQTRCARHGWELPQPQLQRPVQSPGPEEAPCSGLEDGTVGGRPTAGTTQPHPPSALPPASGGSARLPDHRSPTAPSGRASPRQLSSGQEAQQASGPAGSAAGAPATAASWQALYRERYGQACYECFGSPCGRTTLGFAPLQLRLCRACAEAYAAPQPAHRLLSKTEAKWRYCLRDGDLAELHHALDTNPINPAFAPMTLYRRLDVAAAAAARWGSLEGTAAEQRRRLARS